VAVGSRQEGPFDTDTLKQGLAGGRWPKSALVWAEGLPEWVAASDVAELRSALAGTPAGGPPPVRAAVRRGGGSHVIDYRIVGEEMQFVEIELDPGETVVAEAGGMMYMDASVVMDTKLGDGADEGQGLLGKALSAGKRVLTGESLFMTHFTAQGAGKQHVAFASPYPGRIVPLDLAALGGEVLCQKDAFLCAAKGTEVGVAFTKRFGAGLFGGEGFILQRLQGDGNAFVHAGGTIIERELKAGEVLKVDTGCLVAFLPSVTYDIEMVKGVKSMLFGGEGFFFATLKGPGHVWLQSLPFSRLANRIGSAARSGSGKGEGSVLGQVGLNGLSGLFGGE
jgi:uncharacterized protein (TIGR00266 family)